MFLLFHGPDEFSASEELGRLRASGGFELNQDILPGAETDLATIRVLCDTLPFLSERRLVVVRGLPKRKRAAADDESDDEAEARSAPAPMVGNRGKRAKGAAGEGPKAFVAGLAEYAARVPETAVLMVQVDELLEPAHPLVVAARRHGEVREFAPLRGARLEAWMAQRARANNARLAPAATRLLLEAAGDNPRLLANELDKLSTAVGAGGVIEAETVRALTPTARELRAFDLTDALMRRERARGLALLHELLGSGSAPLGILGMVAYQTRTLMQVKSLAERGLRPPQIAQTAGLAPFVVEKSLGMARHFTFAQLEAAHRALLEIDTALKRSQMTPEMALDLLVVGFGAASS